MNNDLEKTLKIIVLNKKTLTKFIKIDTLREIYEFCHYITKKSTTENIKQLFNKNILLKEISDDNLKCVSGGINFKKTISGALASIVLSNTLVSGNNTNTPDILTAAQNLDSLYKKTAPQKKSTLGRKIALSTLGAELTAILGAGMLLGISGISIAATAAYKKSKNNKFSAPSESSSTPISFEQFAFEAYCNLADIYRFICNTTVTPESLLKESQTMNKQISSKCEYLGKLWTKNIKTFYKDFSNIPLEKREVMGTTFHNLNELSRNATSQDLKNRMILLAILSQSLSFNIAENVENINQKLAEEFSDLSEQFAQILGYIYSNKHVQSFTGRYNPKPFIDDYYNLFTHKRLNFRGTWLDSFGELDSNRFLDSSENGEFSYNPSVLTNLICPTVTAEEQILKTNLEESVITELKSKTQAFKSNRNLKEFLSTICSIYSEETLLYEFSPHILPKLEKFELGNNHFFACALGQTFVVGSNNNSTKFSFSNIQISNICNKLRSFPNYNNFNNVIIDGESFAKDELLQFDLYTTSTNNLERFWKDNYTCYPDGIHTINFTNNGLIFKINLDSIKSTLVKKSLEIFGSANDKLKKNIELSLNETLKNYTYEYSITSEKDLDNLMSNFMFDLKNFIPINQEHSFKGVILKIGEYVVLANNNNIDSNIDTKLGIISAVINQEKLEGNNTSFIINGKKESVDNLRKESFKRNYEILLENITNDLKEICTKPQNFITVLNDFDYCTLDLNSLTQNIFDTLLQNKCLENDITKSLDSTSVKAYIKDSIREAFCEAGLCSSDNILDNYKINCTDDKCKLLEVTNSLKETFKNTHFQKLNDNNYLFSTTESTCKYALLGKDNELIYPTNWDIANYEYMIKLKTNLKNNSLIYCNKKNNSSYTMNAENICNYVRQFQPFYELENLKHNCKLLSSLNIKNLPSQERIFNIHLSLSALSTALNITPKINAKAFKECILNENEYLQSLYTGTEANDDLIIFTVNSKNMSDFFNNIKTSLTDNTVINNLKSKSFENINILQIFNNWNKENSNLQWTHGVSISIKDTSENSVYVTIDPNKIGSSLGINGLSASTFKECVFKNSEYLKNITSQNNMLIFKINPSEIHKFLNNIRNSLSDKKVLYNIKFFQCEEKLNFSLSCLSDKQIDLKNRLKKLGKLPCETNDFLQTAKRIHLPSSSEDLVIFSYTNSNKSNLIISCPSLQNVIFTIPKDSISNYDYDIMAELMDYIENEKIVDLNEIKINGEKPMNYNKFTAIIDNYKKQFNENFKYCFDEHLPDFPCFESAVYSSSTNPEINFKAGSRHNVSLQESLAYQLINNTGNTDVIKELYSDTDGGFYSTLTDFLNKNYICHAYESTRLKSKETLRDKLFELSNIFNKFITNDKRTDLIVLDSNKFLIKTDNCWVPINQASVDYINSITSDELLSNIFKYKKSDYFWLNGQRVFLEHLKTEKDLKTLSEKNLNTFNKSYTEWVNRGNNNLWWQTSDVFTFKFDPYFPSNLIITLDLHSLTDNAFEINQIINNIQSYIKPYNGECQATEYSKVKITLKNYNLSFNQLILNLLKSSIPDKNIGVNLYKNDYKNPSYTWLTGFEGKYALTCLNLSNMSYEINLDYLKSYIKRSAKYSNINMELMPFLESMITKYLYDEKIKFANQNEKNCFNIEFGDKEKLMNFLEYINNNFFHQ